VLEEWLNYNSGTDTSTSNSQQVIDLKKVKDTHTSTTEYNPKGD
jgi:hypothetical protein